MDKHRLAEIMTRYVQQQDDVKKEVWHVTRKSLTRSVLTSFLHDVYGLELNEKEEEEEHDELAEECLAAIAAACKQFGTYSYDDKGPDEVMEVRDLVRKFQALDVKAAAHSLRILGNSPKHGNRGRMLAHSLLSDMEDWDELFDQPGIPELY